ncbi:hypothetical protein [Sinomonas susongensis]|uniref:hypothetical protein n=1 Tax=Sinomonas susongensis TaxID=1324851 RepID=UPI00110832AE|nr:hypothetical protein [Sinomonas susongensis]
MSRRILVLDVPAPCDWINANHRPHPLAKARLTRQWREAGHAAVPPGTQPFPGRVRVLAKIYKPRRGIYDPNNLNGTTKAILDGVVDAGLLPDDSFVYVDGPDHRHGGIGQPRVVFEIEELP